MNGLKRNVAALFGNRGKLFVLAMDHAQCGLTEGLERPGEIIEARTEAGLDGFLLNVGLADRYEDKLLGRKLLLRTSSGGTALGSAFTNVHINHVSPETAFRMGADAVVMMLVVGGDDYKSVQLAARDIDAFHQYNLPVVVEILADDFSRTQSYDIQANGARVAAELGADVVKAFFTDNFESVVSNCPAPIILAGGPPGVNLMEMAADAVRCGVRGFAFGRNLFQNKNAGSDIQQLDALLRGNGD